MSCDLTVNERHGLNVMWKTVSNYCNLACDYCYFNGCNGMKAEEVKIQTHLLQKFIKQYMKGVNKVASFAWQGGEPLLAGLDFFYDVVEMQVAFAPPHTSINNVIQTNGTLINEQWARFFKQYNFLVGVSIDGPPEIHDRHRTYSSGAGSYEAVMRGIDWLRKYEVDFNILTVIHEENVQLADQLMQFYEQEHFTYVQWIPAMNFKAQDNSNTVDYFISPASYGNFLCDAFDIWIKEGQPKTSIRVFDNLLTHHMNHPPELCIHQESCPKTLVIESNGDVYPCDFYMHESFKLGNVDEDSLSAILTHPKYAEFLDLKSTLPETCRSCEYLSLCHGGCPRNRRWISGKITNPDYFCTSYRQLYAHSQEKLSSLAQKIRQEWKHDWVESGHSLPARNESCFCGSGLKFKKCCGR
ncbi:anaerobic sulfatase maturase [Chengkuizengella axinellae]|uniref:Anaerobic sulfatase maturase n=1 Tax=Chengkuizengella axinellae TaxID=3064388 RepID=A0ABT9IZL8_9BACL|nr:anaerobic sulfatase maturase [Chengkuizengella sp. 2205SS18-9]MDP5274821.1 anaerobic sulfatase maturase [Chengkuizengella sp. 2205SS18-9]